MENAIKKESFAKLTTTEILKSFPRGFATCKSEGDCKKLHFDEMDGYNQCIANIDSLSQYFAAINEYNNDNHDKQIQEEHASVILWTGNKGEAKGKEEAGDNGNDVSKRSSKQFSAARLYVDTDILVLQLAFQVIDPLKDENGEKIDEDELAVLENDFQKVAFRTFLCMWLIYNADETKPIRQYSSIAGYEKYVAVGESGEGTINRGLAQLRKNKVTKALLIGSYFWKIEMIAIARRNKECQVDIYLMNYIIDEAMQNDDLPRCTDEWDGPQNLFDTKVPNLPIIFRADDGTYTQFYVKEAPTLHKLINVYRTSSRGSGINTKTRISDDIGSLIEFVQWTSTYAAEKLKDYDKEEQPIKLKQKIINIFFGPRKPKRPEGPEKPKKPRKPRGTE